MRALTLSTLIILSLVSAACSKSPAFGDAMAVPGSSAASDWASYGGSYAEDHNSPNAEITASNVGKLGLAWSLDLPGERSLEGTPLAIEGKLYFSGTGGTTYAVDARSGELIWKFDPDTASYDPQRIRISMGAHRGVAYWRGKVFVGATDGRLFALDAKTGKIVWKVDSFDDGNRRKNISGAPRVFNGKVVIGQGGAEFRTRGYLTAYDAETGARVWRFHTVPGDPAKSFENSAMAMAAKTWKGEWWKWGGGGTPWDNLTYDPGLNRLYIGVGNGGPWNRELRSPGGGDNLFLSSIVAVDADTGKYIWHYQVTPGDTWDYKATTNMIIADLMIKGVRTPVLMQAPTNGFFYVLDRKTGKLISAEQFAKATWASKIDLKTGRPVETANARYQAGPQLIWPASSGAHNWQPMAYNAQLGLVYIPTMKMAMRCSASPDGPDIQRSLDKPDNGFFVVGSSCSQEQIDPDDGTAALLAWDPVAQRKRWEVRYADSYWNGGILSTDGGLVFQGIGRGYFNAYDATTGKTLWRFYAGLGIIGAPISYTMDGRQYIAILVGYGGAAGFGGKLMDYGWRYGEQMRRLLVFALGKSKPLPPMGPPRFALRPVDDAKLHIDIAAAQNGAIIYHLSCVACHGGGVVSVGSVAPDLRESAAALDYSMFRSILKDGLLGPAGMPSYSDLSDEDIRALYMYVRQAARSAFHPPMKAKPAPGGGI